MKRDSSSSKKSATSSSGDSPEIAKLKEQLRKLFDEPMPAFSIGFTRAREGEMNADEKLVLDALADKLIADRHKTYVSPLPWKKLTRATGTFNTKMPGKADVEVERIDATAFGDTARTYVAVGKPKLYIDGKPMGTVTEQKVEVDGSITFTWEYDET